MPRFVRPAYIEGNNGDGTRFGTGPRSREGWLSAALTVRTPGATVSDGVGISAGGRFGRIEIDVPASFRVELETRDDGRTTMLIRQRAEIAPDNGTTIR